MIRLAALADVHANLPALEAVLADIASQGADGYLVAGDALGGPQPNEVIERLAGLDPCWMIRGNNENYHLQYAEGRAPAAWWRNRQMAFVRWSYYRLTHDNLRQIMAWPEQAVVADAIRVVHGSPRSASEYFLPEKHPAQLAQAMADASEAVLVFGHSHVPWQARQNGRLAFNPGSVGVPLSGDQRAQYAILTGQNHDWDVEFHAVGYDLTRIREAFFSSGLYAYSGAFGRGYLYDILTGRDILPEFVKFAYQLAEANGSSDGASIPDEVWEQAAATFPWPEDCWSILGIVK